MRNTKKRQALDLLFVLRPEEAAGKLEVSVRTLRGWLAQPEFARALRQRHRERREAAQRIAAEGALAAAREVGAAIQSGDEKAVSKTALEVLKLSGTFSAPSEAEDDGEQLSAFIAQATKRAAESGEG